MTTFTAACLQLSPSDDLDANLAKIERLVSDSARRGAQLVALPEYATFLHRSGQAMRKAATKEEASRAISALRALASAREVWILVGSLALLADSQRQDRLVNRSLLIDHQGRIVGRYDKIHLFDATMSDGRVVGESKHYHGGEAATLVRTPFGGLGMSICYDLRFPHLYRALALRGAEILAAPAAFTYETGKAHWEVLLRARAIETGSFVLAPATCGVHPGDWRTYGHAAIVNPWGEVIAACDGDSEVNCIAEIDISLCSQARARIPSLTTNPPFAVHEFDSAVFERGACHE